MLLLVPNTPLTTAQLNIEAMTYGSTETTRPGAISYPFLSTIAAIQETNTNNRSIAQRVIRRLTTVPL